MRLPNSHRLAASMDYRGEELEFRSHSGLRIAAKRWGYADGFPLLALHAWYDNCATWDPAVAVFEARHPSIRFDMVAMDFAGHGQSDHRGLTSAYSRLFDIEDALAVVNALGWKEFAILGHSMGGFIAVYLAGLYPERIKHVVAIETVIPLLHPPDTYTEAILEAFKERGEYASRVASQAQTAAPTNKRVFASLDEAAQVRTKGMYPLALEPSRILVGRGTKPVIAADGSGKTVGYEWSSDSRVRMIGRQVMLSTEFTMNVIGRIQCPTFTPLPIQKAFRGHLYLQRVKGSTNHHMHMEEPFAAVIADMIVDFWARVADGSLPPSQVTPVSKL
ncbi:Alpha/Beta hydrolase protein [Entophlyctis helioformis]|nr:Alpha/Beta hydrolase protein [Entophlyctis helioformis]